MQEVTAPPQSQACVICWTWPALGLLDCNAGSGCLLARLVGICGTGPAGLVERKANFKKIVNRMGRWPGYGGSAVAMENGRPMGICQNVWGDASGVWPYGETAIPYEEAAHVWGGRGIAWRTKVA